MKKFRFLKYKKEIIFWFAITIILFLLAFYINYLKNGIPKKTTITEFIDSKNKDTVTYSNLNRFLGKLQPYMIKSVDPDIKKISTAFNNGNLKIKTYFTDKGWFNKASSIAFYDVLLIIVGAFLIISVKNVYNTWSFKNRAGHIKRWHNWLLDLGFSKIHKQETKSNTNSYIDLLNHLTNSLESQFKNDGGIEIKLFYYGTKSDIYKLYDEKERNKGIDELYNKWKELGLSTVRRNGVNIEYKIFRFLIVSREEHRLDSNTDSARKYDDTFVEGKALWTIPIYLEDYPQYRNHKDEIDFALLITSHNSHKIVIGFYENAVTYLLLNELHSEIQSGLINDSEKEQKKSIL